MYFSDLCTDKNAVFMVFERFPQLYPSKAKTPLDARVIAPGFGYYRNRKITL